MTSPFGDMTFQSALQVGLGHKLAPVVDRSKSESVSRAKKQSSEKSSKQAGKRPSNQNSHLLIKIHKKSITQVRTQSINDARHVTNQQTNQPTPTNTRPMSRTCETVVKGKHFSMVQLIFTAGLCQKLYQTLTV